MSNQTWETGRRRPRNSPPGWFDLHFAFNNYVRALIGSNAWRLRWLLDVLPHETAPDCLKFFEGEMLTHEQYVSLNLSQICQSFCTVAQTTRLRTAYRLKGGGAWTPMPQEWWHTDDELLRFRTNAIDPDEPFSAADDLPCWILVHADDQAALSQEAENWRKALPPFGQLHAPTPEEFRETDVLDQLGRPLRIEAYVEESENREVYIAPPGFPHSRVVPPAHDSSDAGLRVTESRRCQDPTQILDWAEDAVRRDVPIREAGADAKRALGDVAPSHMEARKALREAMASAGKIVTRGRRTGSKSFAKG